jgi:lipid-binding SYLF domain-containing protein
MNKAKILFSGACLALLAFNASAATKVERRVDNATEVIQKFTQIPEDGIEAALLQNAYGIAIIPNTIKVGLGIGGRYGKGVIVVRRPDGGWSNPSFISLYGGSFGWQIGAQGTDLILVFKSKKSVDNIARTKFTLGGDASVAAGPVGRQTSAATDEIFKAEIYSYSRSRGLFAGISLEGSIIGMDEKSNLAFYRTGQGDAEDILTDSTLALPIQARRLVEAMNTAAPRIAMHAPAKTASNDVNTYSLEDGPPSNTEY